MTVGERLRTLWISFGLSQAELGRIVGVTKAAIQKYESGQIKNFKIDTISGLRRKYCAALAENIHG